MKNKDILNNSIILIGPMCVGKTTIAKLLRKNLNMKNISLDNKDQLKYLYQNINSFKNQEEFNLYLVKTIISNLKSPAIIDFGANHSIYNDINDFKKIKNTLKDFKNIIFLIPSTNTLESIEILTKRKKELLSTRPYNKKTITSPCNYNLATITIYTKNKTKEQTYKEILKYLNQ